MATTKIPTPGEGDGVDAFFARCGFPSHARDQCWLLVQQLFPDAEIEEANPQGYCSYTLCVGVSHIVQFRPPAHKLHMAVAEAAYDAYGDLAPRTQLLTVLKPTRSLLSKSHHRGCNGSQCIDEGVVMDDDQDFLDVVSMTRMRGISLSESRASSAGMSMGFQPQQQRLTIVRDFARFMATGWNHAHKNAGSETPCIRGRIGSSLRWRLEQMHTLLPPRFQPFVIGMLSRLDNITSLPWVLTHGDIVPANIMVEPSQHTPSQYALTGLLDWAEAEYLPLGVGLYGLEELLGEHDASGRFSYYSDEIELRALFWAHLETDLGAGAPALNSLSRGLVDDAHTLGVLLWHGIAFDDGKLDRVVQEGRDDEEIMRLDLFFAGRM